MNYLLDNWKNFGTTLEEFQRDISYLDSHTEIVPMRTKPELENDGVYTLLSQRGKRIAAKRGDRDVVMTVPDAKDAEEVLSEAVGTTKFMLRNEGLSYLLSEDAYLTFEQRLKMGACIQIASEERNRFIEQIMRKANTSWKFCVRKVATAEGNVRKIFAVFSEEYAPVKQEILHSIVKTLLSGETTMGKGEFISYEISHRKTEITLEFPESAFDVATGYGYSENYIPTLKLVTSDTGHHPFSVSALIRKKSCSSYTALNRMELRHRGKPIEKEMVISLAMDSVFPWFTKLPDLLVEYCLMEASYPDVEELVKKILKKAKFTAHIGKKNSMKVQELVLEEYIESETYTVYDVVSSFLSLPERLEGLPEYLKKGLEDACGAVPFLPFLKKMGKEETGSSEDDLYLLG